MPKSSNVAQEKLQGFLVLEIMWGKYLLPHPFPQSFEFQTKSFLQYLAIFPILLAVPKQSSLPIKIFSSSFVSGKGQTKRA